MGTNYYLKTDCCPHCGRGDSQKHVGKSSFGWCFALRVYPDDGINTLEDWKQIFNKPDSKIEDEYGNPVTPLEMLSTITERSHPKKDNPYGYESWAQFHAQNYSQDGPNGCLRHKIMPGDCIGHGDGTFDYMIRDFS